ncbi:hypothetical protein B0H16DRAFT_1463906 [Mycena metata]|uniref:Uncharacterized protein n=1 Tax=Mycena metata TaxID=1033252 RepID=A0AAD7II29_9AGAR|nr:hypothetical protein B0H16DRAFT_1463906 [Mycena metata]
MSYQNTAREDRIHNLRACLAPALALLEELNDAFGPAFIQLIITSLQALAYLNSNKEECFQLVKSIHQVVYPIIHLYLRSESAGALPPLVVDKIAQFTETLHKISRFIEIQQDSNRIKQFFRQSEVNKLLKDCHMGLNQAIEVFKVQHEAETMQKQLLELVATLSDGTVSDKSHCNNSFSMLPSKPKIFYDRDYELKDIIKMLSQLFWEEGAWARHLSQGPLSIIQIHVPDLSTDSLSEPTTTVIELAALIGLHLGLELGQDVMKLVTQYFTRQSSPCLLILDNLETPWEPVQSRGGVESFLSLLADVDHLALIITLRGSERPGQVRWTRPFLQPLQPLSDHASQQIFEEITDDSHDSEEKTQLLAFTENMPLAVDLMAHLVDHEGLGNVLACWKIEKTVALSAGYHRTSNLDASIALLCSSPRITPGARELLSLLSILLDGLSDIELTQSSLPISDIQSCKSVLIATSLAYKDTKS